MKSEQEPIAEDEILLRLVWPFNVKAGDPPKIKPRGFEPRKDETTGISVFRLSCVSVPAEVLLAIRDPEKRRQYLIAGLPVSALKEMGLTAVPDPIETVAGHAVLSELNSTAWNTEKEKWLPITEKLAQLAGQMIVHNPNDQKASPPENPPAE